MLVLGSRPKNSVELEAVQFLTPEAGLMPLPLPRTLPEQVGSVALADFAACHADAHPALRSVITEALAELWEIERRGHREGRPISRGYGRARLSSTQAAFTLHKANQKVNMILGEPR